MFHVKHLFVLFRVKAFSRGVVRKVRLGTVGALVYSGMNTIVKREGDSMLRISDTRIDGFIAEDVPYVDLTCAVLGIGDEPGEMEYFTREDCVLAGANVVRRIMAKLGCDVVEARRDGERAAAGETFFRVRGAAGDLHAAWKVCLNVFDHMSAVATKTRAMVNAAHAANPRCEVLTTRKSMPGAKDLLTEAVMAGGAFPHRLGLSETVLVFEHHLTFFGGFDAFVEQLPAIKGRCVEKKLFVEADAERARVLARAGVDGIQVDKVPVDELESLVRELRTIDPCVTLIAAGGVNPQNAGAYAATGVDGLATTAPFSAKPLDMSVRMRML